jgi:hypothetical protein
MPFQILETGNRELSRGKLESFLPSPDQVVRVRIIQGILVPEWCVLVR